MTFYPPVNREALDSCKAREAASCAEALKFSHSRFPYTSSRELWNSAWAQAEDAHYASAEDIMQALQASPGELASLL